jgi:hypothetical protein
VTSPTMGPLDLGRGHTLRFTHWTPDRTLNPQYDGTPDIDPLGAVIDHRQPDGTPCSGSLTFASPAADQLFPDEEKWDVQSFQPLTLDQSVICPTCGDHGLVKDGRWVPA